MPSTLFGKIITVRFHTPTFYAAGPLWLQVEVKSQLLLSPSTAYRGYQPLGTNVTRHETGFTPDLHEALDFFK
jgi:hypothetical protein